MKKILLLLIIPFLSFGQTPIAQDSIHKAVLLHPDAVETYHPYSKNTGDTCRFCPHLTNGPYGFYLISTGPGMCKAIVKDADMNTVFEARGGYCHNAKLLIQEAKKDLGIL